MAKSRRATWSKQLVAGLVAAAAVVVGAGAAVAAPTIAPGSPWAIATSEPARPARPGLARALDPFRKEGAARPEPLLPFRVAETAAPAPAPAPATDATTAPAPAAPVCTSDAQCPAETICQDGRCQSIERRTNILYLYYREGTFMEVLGLYWAKRGATGYTVLAPFYWHFWSPTRESRVIAPFFWRFRDRVRQSTLTVIVPGLPVSWTDGPDERSIGIWPLYYSSSKFGWAAPLLGSFHIVDPDRRTSAGAALYLYWWTRRPDRAFDLFVPFFASRRSPAKTFTWALPLNFYWRDHNVAKTLIVPLLYARTQPGASTVVTPLGYSSRGPTSSKGSVLWLLWHGQDHKDRSAYDVLFPFLWSFESPKKTTKIIFPLYWDVREKSAGGAVFFPFVWSFWSSKGRTVLAPPVLHVRRETWTFTTVFPLWWSGRDGAEGSSFATLLPLFHWSRGDHGKRLRWLTPLGGYSRDDAAGTRTLALLPFFFVRHDKEGAFHLLSPLFIRNRNTAEASLTRLYGLLYYRRDDDQGSTTSLFPFFWRFKEAATGATATALLPFFAHRQGPRDTSTYAGIFPIWYFKRSFTGGGWSAGLTPLAWFGNHRGASHSVIVPFWWRFTRPEASTTVLAPLYWAHRDREGKSGGVPPALFFWGDRAGDSYRVQFPLFWHLASAREGWSTTVTPIGFLYSGRDGWNGGAGPLLPILFAGRRGDRSHFVLFPLFWHFGDRGAQRSTTVVLNYLHRRHGGETTDALFPLFHFRRGTRPGAKTPETSFTLFPLIHYRNDPQARVLVTPLGASIRTAQRSGGFLGPYFWYRGLDVQARGVPFLYMDVGHKNAGDRIRQFGPYFRVDGPGRRAHILLPLFGSYDVDGDRGTYVFPTFFHRRTSDGYRADALLPLFWHSRWRDQSTTVIGPWYRRSSPEKLRTGLIPLYVYSRDTKAETDLVIPPLLAWYHADARQNSARLLAPLVYHTRAGESSRTVVFPLWWARRDGTTSSRSLFPVYWHAEDSAENRSWTLAGPLFWSRQGAAWTRGLLPIAWMSKDPQRGASSQALMPLFYRSKGPDHSSFYTLLAGYSRHNDGRSLYVLPYFDRDRTRSRFWTLFPLWFSHTDKVLEKRVTVSPPLLHVGWSSPESRTATYLGLFWHHRDIDSSTTLGLPLYFDVHDFHHSRTTILLPLFVRHHREADKTTTWVAPLFYRRSTPTDITTIGFPLLWDFKRGGDRTTVFVPFFAHWTRPTYQATWVFPTYYYREGRGPAAGTYRRIVAPFWESAVKRPGDYMWEVLGGLFGHERIGRNNFLKLFFIPFETGTPTPAQTAWYGKQRPRRGADVPKGVSANVW